jgi:hypothetical protein
LSAAAKKSTAAAFRLAISEFCRYQRVRTSVSALPADGLPL